MSERLLPEPHRYASCPFDGNILEYYSGYFEAVYLLLHPFIKPRITPCEREPYEWENKTEFIDTYLEIPWNKILKETGLTSFSEIDLALQTMIGAIRKQPENFKFVNTLDQLSMNDPDLRFPSEGDLSIHLEHRLLKVLKSLGIKWLWVGDQHCTERKLVWLEDLFNKQEVPTHGCIFTYDHKTLITTHWDSHCSFLCSSKKTLEKILSIDIFEGFYCTNNTEVFWSSNPI